MPMRYVDVIRTKEVLFEDRRRRVPPRRPVGRLVQPRVDDEPFSASLDIETGMANDAEIHTRGSFGGLLPSPRWNRALLRRSKRDRSRRRAQRNARGPGSELAARSHADHVLPALHDSGEVAGKAADRALRIDRGVAFARNSQRDRSRGGAQVDRAVAVDPAQIRVDGAGLRLDADVPGNGGHRDRAGNVADLHRRAGRNGDPITHAAGVITVRIGRNDEDAVALAMDADGDAAQLGSIVTVLGCVDIYDGFSPGRNPYGAGNIVDVNDRRRTAVDGLMKLFVDAVAERPGARAERH